MSYNIHIRKWQMTDKQLSPAAQEVLDATRFEVNAECHAPWIAAAVLRAVADEVAPNGYEKVWKDSHWVEYEKENTVRKKLFAIANELEAL